MSCIHWKPQLFSEPRYSGISVSFLETYETEESMRSGKWALHSHEDTYEIGVYLCGELYTRHDEDVFTPISGDIQFYTPGELHCGVIREPCLVSRVNFFVPVRAAEAFAADGFDLVAFCRAAEEKGQPHMLRLPAGKLQELMRLLYEMREALEQATTTTDALAYSGFLRFFVMLNEAYAAGEKELFTPPPTGIIREACEYIDRHYGDISSLSEVADALHVNYSYLSARFRRQMNITVSDYLNYRRLSRSRYLLASGKSVTEACYDAGFSSLSYFIKLFRQLYGTTPGGYAADK